MKNRPVVYKTLDELRDQIIEKISDPETGALFITRAHEIVFGTLISRAEGQDAPEGKYKVVLTNPLPN